MTGPTDPSLIFKGFRLVNMSSGKRARKVSPREVEILTTIISEHREVEGKSKTNAMERKKKETWEKIATEFNSRENVNRRDVKQLKVSTNRVHVSPRFHVLSIVISLFKEYMDEIENEREERAGEREKTAVQDRRRASSLREHE